MQHLTFTRNVRLFTPDLARICLNQRPRTCGEAVGISFTSRKSAVPRKSQTPLRSNNANREQILYRLARFENFGSEVLRSTNAVLFQTSHRTFFLPIFSLTVMSTFSGLVCQRTHPYHLLWQVLAFGVSRSD